MSDAIHQRLETCLEEGDDAAVYRTLQEATADIDGWLDEWDARMSALLPSLLESTLTDLRHAPGASQPTAGFFRSSAAIQRAYAHLFHNCIALRRLKTVADAKSLSPEMRAIALQAIGSAKECVSICLNNQEYRSGMKYAGALFFPFRCAWTYRVDAPSPPRQWPILIPARLSLEHSFYALPDSSRRT